MKRQTVDWWRLLWDLTHRGVPLAKASRLMGENRETIRAYAYGAHPPHWRGELIIDLWCEVCAKERKDLPMCELVITPRVVNRDMKVTDDAARELERAWR